MKKKIAPLFIIILLTIFSVTAINSKNLHFGIISAVKSKVKELDQKIKEKSESSKLIISGTAAKGKPIVSAAVSVKDANGMPKSGVTGTDGKFTIDITALTLPCLLKITEGSVTYFSIAHTSGTCNIHPFTDIVVRAYFRSSSGITDMKTAFENNYASLGTLPTVEAIKTRKTALIDIIDSILERQGINPLTYDIFTTPFDADSTGFDKAIDETQITADVTFGTVTIMDATTGIILSNIVDGVISQDTLPTVSIEIPAESSIIAAIINVTADVSDDNGINKVQFFVDDVIKSTDTTAPYSYLWDTTLYSDALHTVKVTVYDTAEQTATDQHTVTVDNIDDSPAISISDPVDGSTVTATVTVSVNASDDKGINRVQFFVDDVIKSTDTTAPYSYLWDTTLYSDALHTVKVTVYDTADQTATDQHTVTVDNVPVVTIIETAFNANLDGMTKEEVLVFRKAKVENYADTGIFPVTYEPNTGIYENIVSGKSWTENAAAQVANPYSLITLTYAGYLTPVGEGKLTNTSLESSGNRIEETHTDADALEWFSMLFVTNNEIEVRMVNAFDAGYIYVSVDKVESNNIDFSYRNDSLNIANLPHSVPGYYHVGQSDKNNYSPVDPDARIKIDQTNAETIIYVNLWKNEPVDVNQEPDMVYVVNIIP